MGTETLPKIPAKVQALLDLAARLEMQVEFKADDRPSSYSTVHTWTIKSGKAHDPDCLWIYWTPGANGGRVRLVAYRPYARREPRRVTYQTYRSFRRWMRLLSPLPLREADAR